MADVDYNVGIVLEALKRLNLDRNTFVLWCTDNGAEGRRPWRGSSGPWRGFYNTVMEGGIRTPCVMRWVGRIPRGQVSNEIVHELDIFPTIAAAVGAEVPNDRADRRRQHPAVPRRQAIDVRPRERALLHRLTGARGEVEGLEVPLRVHARAARDRAAAHAPVQPAIGSARGVATSRTPTRGRSASSTSWSPSSRPAREAFPNVPPNAKDPYTPPARRP